MNEKNQYSYNYFVYHSNYKYPNVPPYNPEIKYPEYPFEYKENSHTDSNDIYRMIREIFVNSNMDVQNYNTANWNPLGDYISPGDTVLIKPNLVMHDNPSVHDEAKKLDCLVTHPSIVRCIFDYIYIALKEHGKIIIADAPVQECKFDVLLQKSGYGDLFKVLKSKKTKDLDIVIADLRDTVLDNTNGKQRQKHNANKQYDSKIIDLGNDSKFTNVKGKNKFRVTNYAAKETTKHHNGKVNQYCVSEVILEVDVIINLPKPKTHRIAGYTGALKNMIGINTRKEYLPHHRKGSKEKKGDEYIGTHKLLKWVNSNMNDIKNLALDKQFDLIVDICNRICRYTGRRLDKLENNRKKFGMWYGNDTIWRTILDVNKIVYFCDKQGCVCNEQQRKVIHFGDMVVCGENEGPLRPSYKKVGGILFSDNPVSFDYCVVKLMGFDYKKLPVLDNALKDDFLINEKTDEIRLHSNEESFDKLVDDINISFKFEPSDGWKDYL